MPAWCMPAQKCDACRAPQEIASVKDVSLWNYNAETKKAVEQVQIYKGGYPADGKANKKEGAPGSIDLNCSNCFMAVPGGHQLGSRPMILHGALSEPAQGTWRTWLPAN